MSRGASTSAPQAVNFAWLVKLRWGAIAGQLATVLGVVHVMGIPVPLVPLLVIIGVELATNVAFAVWSRRGGTAGDWVGAAVTAFDVLLLTALLFFTGGPFNPFSFLYLVYIALAAVVLRPRWTWTLVVLSLVCSAVLFLDHHTLELPAKTHAEHMRLHLQGMWVAFGVAAGFIVWFLLRITRALAARDAELQAARARQDRLTSLTTLAAGAAHELATPLSTIAVVTRELERQLGTVTLPDAVVEDVRLIRAQVDRCRQILDHMSAHAGDRAGEGLSDTTVGALLDEAVSTLAAAPCVRLVRPEDAAAAALRVPSRALAQAIRGVIKNAQEASAEGAEVEVAAALADDGRRVRIAVRDEGGGMPRDVLARAGEPFFTTKSPGHGMGLGLFLTRAVVEQLGGELTLDSVPGRGTTAVLLLPRAIAATTHRTPELP